MIVRQVSPHPRLAAIVRRYQCRTAGPDEPKRRIPLPARTDVLLEFYFTTPHLLELQATRTFEQAPRVVVVGPQTFRRVDLILSGRLDVFTINFSPTGLHALLGLPMAEVTDAGIDAAAVFGSRAIGELHDRLAGAADLATRARRADAFLLDIRDRRGGPVATDSMDAVLKRMGDPAAGEGTAGLARTAGLSERQFRRVFAQQVGMGPKRYARVVRLEAALARRRSAPGMSWAAIAHECGWFDQAHMDKDFLDLTGNPPSRLLPTIAAAAPMAGPY